MGLTLHEFSAFDKIVLLRWNGRINAVRRPPSRPWDTIMTQPKGSLV